MGYKTRLENPEYLRIAKVLLTQEHDNQPGKADSITLAKALDADSGKEQYYKKRNGDYSLLRHKIKNLNSNSNKPEATIFWIEKAGMNTISIDWAGWAKHLMTKIYKINPQNELPKVLYHREGGPSSDRMCSNNELYGAAGKIIKTYVGHRQLEAETLSIKDILGEITELLGYGGLNPKPMLLNPAQRKAWRQYTGLISAMAINRHPGHEAATAITGFQHDKALVL